MPSLPDNFNNASPVPKRNLRQRLAFARGPKFPTKGLDCAWPRQAQVTGAFSTLRFRGPWAGQKSHDYDRNRDTTDAIRLAPFIGHRGYTGVESVLWACVWSRLTVVSGGRKGLLCSEWKPREDPK